MSVQLHQVLFGYANGHRRIAGSKEFDVRTERELLRLSDLSGPVSGPGFDDYLTAFGLRSAPLYAFSRTWAATNAPRPGLVWTRTLVLDADAVAQVQDLAPIVAFLRELQSEDLSSIVLEPLTVRTSTDPGSEADGADYPREALDVLGALLSKDGSPASVLIPSQDAISWERFLLDLWRLLWPGLRMGFSFTTGGLRFRTLSDGSPFDVQVVPKAQARRISIQGSENARLVGERDSGTKPAVALRERVLNGLAQRHALQSFLYTFSADVPASLPTWATLCSIEYQWNQAQSNDPKLVGLVARAFPLPDDAATLKYAMFGPDSRFAASEKDTLLAFMELRNRKAFDGVALGISARLRAVGSDALFAQRLAGELSSTPLSDDLAESALEYLATSLGDDLTVGIIVSNPDMAAELIRRNTAIACRVDLWEMSPPIPAITISVLRELNPSRELLRAVSSAILLTESPAAPLEAAVSALGAPLVQAILDVMERAARSGEELAIDDSTYISSHVTAVAEWLAERSTMDQQLLSRILSYLNPVDPELLRLPVQVWLRLVPQEPRADSITALAFGYAIALQNPSGGAERLASKVFGGVYSAVRYGRLSSAEREWILTAESSIHRSASTKRTGAYLDLNSLHQMLAAAFIQHGWPVVDWVRCYKDPGSFREALELALDAPDLNKLAADARDLLARRQLTIPPWQRGVLRSPARSGLFATLRRLSKGL